MGFAFEDDKGKIPVTRQQLGYLSGLNGNVQTQINNLKQAVDGVKFKTYSAAAGETMTINMTAGTRGMLFVQSINDQANGIVAFNCDNTTAMVTFCEMVGVGNLVFSGSAGKLKVRNNATAYVTAAAMAITGSVS